MNKVMLFGNLGMDPELSVTSSGTQRAYFTLATTRIYKNAQGEKVSNTQWHECVAWRNTAALVNSILQKGTQVLLEGSIEYWEYEREGVKVKRAQIIVSEFYVARGQAHKEHNPLLEDSKPRSTEFPSHSVKSDPMQISTDFDNKLSDPLGDDDLPF